MENKDIIKDAMKEKGYDIKKLSLLSGVSQAYLYHLTNEDIKLGKRVAEKLNRTLDIDLEYTGKNKENIDSIGYKIFKLRSTHNWSVEKLATISDLGIDTLYKIEKNKHKPNKKTLLKLAKAFEIQVSEFIKN